VDGDLRNQREGRATASCEGAGGKRLRNDVTRPGCARVGGPTRGSAGGGEDRERQICGSLLRRRVSESKNDRRLTEIREQLGAGGYCDRRSLRPWPGGFAPLEAAPGGPKGVRRVLEAGQ